jgi:peptidoglycan/LPS O-acetylase OafA/YrhL
MQDQLNRIARIDVLRAIAILIVFSDHFYVATHGQIGYAWHGSWFQWADSPSPMVKIFRCTIFDGAWGVSLFFVISGLCIRLSHLAAREFTIAHFYWRRFWRIYPSYLLALALFVTVQQYRNISDILCHVFLVHNCSISYFFSINRPFWSLALEVQVYLLYPLLLLMHSRWGAVRTAIVLFGLSAASAVIGGERFCALLGLPVLKLAWQLPMRLWFTWYAGFLLAEMISSNIRPSRRSRLILIIAILLFPLVRLYRPLMTIETPVAGIILALLALEYLNASPRFRPIGGYLACLGICSYSFYLYFDQLTGPVLHAVSNYGHISSFAVLCGVGYPVTLLIIFIFSYVAYRIVEMGSISIGRILYARLNTR